MQKLNFIDMNDTTSIFDETGSKKICHHLNRKFSSFLKNEIFEIESGYKGDQIQMKLVLSNQDKTFFYPVEAVCIQDNAEENDAEEKMKPNDAALLMLEYLTLYFEEFLSEDREVFLPIDWSVHHCDEFSFFLRGFVRNLKVEKITDEFLSQHGHGEQNILPISSEY